MEKISKILLWKYPDKAPKKSKMKVSWSQSCRNDDLENTQLLDNRNDEEYTSTGCNRILKWCLYFITDWPCEITGRMCSDEPVRSDRTLQVAVGHTENTRQEAPKKTTEIQSSLSSPESSQTLKLGKASALTEQENFKDDFDKSLVRPKPENPSLQHHTGGLPSPEPMNPTILPTNDDSITTVPRAIVPTENTGAPASRSDNGDEADKPLVCILFMLYQLLGILLVVVGFIFQLLTCFRRDRISTNLMPILNTTKNERQLSCNDRSEIICGVIIPNAVIVLLACWVYLGLKFGNNHCCKCCGWKELFAVVRADSKNYLRKLVRVTKRRKLVLIFYILISFFYLILSCGVGGIYLYVFQFTKEHVVIQPPFNLTKTVGADVLRGDVKYGFIAAAFIGSIAFDLLYIRVIMRYACRCQMIIYFLKSIGQDICKYDIKVQQTINKGACNFIKDLNASSATVGFIVIIAAYQAANCTVILFDDDITYGQGGAVVLRLILWGFLAVFPFHKAGGVNIAAKKLHDTGWDMHRPHHNNLNGSDNGVRITIKARIFGITVNPWLPYVVVVILLITIMIGSKFKWYDHVL